MAMGDPIRVRVVRKTDEALPAYETAQSAGMDLRANLEEPIALAPGERALVPTGLFLQIPDGYEAQVRPRSGLALKRGLTVLNSPGTIDQGYRGECCVMLFNTGNGKFTIKKGDRIAQFVVNKLPEIYISEVSEEEFLEDTTSRGNGGFGSTGVF